MKITIVGGGISGISLAYLLHKHTKHEVLIIEKNHLGGKAKTIKKDSYLIETGPNGFLENKKETIKLIDESNFNENLIESNDNARKRYIYSNGKLHLLPSNPVKLLFGNLLSKKTILSLAKEPFVKPKIEDETVENFVKRRLNEELLNKIIGPMVCGVFAADPSKMSMKANFPKMKEIETKYGSLIKGLISLMLDKKAKASSASGGFDAKLLSFKNGMESFIKHLSKDIQHSKDEIVSIKEELKGYTLFGKKNTYKTDMVIFATEAYALAKIIKNLDENISYLLKNIPYSPMAVVSVGFKRKQLPQIVNSFGYLFDLNEIKDTIGVLFDSSIFQYRSSNDKFLIRLMIGGALTPLSPFNNNLFEIAVKELQRSAHIFAPFEFSYSIVHPKAIPMYDMKHTEIIEAIEEFQNRNRRILITGNAFYGVSFNDCIKSSYKILEKIKAG